MSQLASIAADGSDPRFHLHEREKIDVYAGGASTAIRPQHRRLHDSSVTFEEYYYYAQQTRAEEEANTQRETGILSVIFPSKKDVGVQQTSDNVHKDASAINYSKETDRMTITDEEWLNASRALRTASRGAIFYLITTDILGPFGLPYAFASMGWGPGIALFTVFAGLAGYSGYLLWHAFCGLDSYYYPVRSFGDLGFRLYGPWLRYLFNILQGIQLVLNVGLIVISNGEALSQAAQFKLCYIICCMIWAVVGFALGQVRTLQKFGWLANAAVWLNLMCMFVTMGGASHYPPNYSGASQAAGKNIGDGSSVAPVNGVYPPVMTTGGLPKSPTFAGTVSGAMQAVFAYGGSMIFPEFMAEMKRPKDFLTAMWSAQTFIYVVYMFYGLFMYGYQGQYVINPSYLGISNYVVQTIGNVFAMIGAMIAAALYGNIGVKVIYNNILVEFFHFPPLTNRAGKILWIALIPIYWAIAFCIAAGIPNFSGITSVVAAFCILQFTYTFPPMLATYFWIKKAALQDGEGFDPVTGHSIRHDRGLRRIVRGFLAQKPKYLLFSTFNIFYFLGALALAGLGAYSSITILRDSYASGATTSFTCHSPLDG
ncbi:amino acid transporter [Penicillium diatomitis]|uniref:Amino acid transporter n=1 Tax=Penicillium diatomitis TaxID=2819901 RepID=A0A9X0C2H3_9EURO|nr:amino acid transporter [Penicillium diatomitis]KAJ5495145.1 amino acid transporter [Penicillium diatomitis]